MFMKGISAAAGILLLVTNLHMAGRAYNNITDFSAVYPYPYTRPWGFIAEPVPAIEDDPDGGSRSGGEIPGHDAAESSREYHPGTAVMEEDLPGREPAEISGPIVTSLPENNVFDPRYISFKREVQAIIRDAREFSGMRTPVGVFVMDLCTGFYTGVNDTRTRFDPNDGTREGYFNSASVIKLFQGYILYDMLRRGELDEDEVYTDQVTGRSFRLMDMIHTMISRSDNNYSNACLRLIGNAKSNEVLVRLGITDSVIYGEMSGAIGYSLRNNLEKYGTTKRCARITPNDTGLILYNIYINKDSDPYMAALNRALLANIYNSRIPVGVRKVNKGYEIAHKTGTNISLGVYNDAGIIYGRRPFILVAFTQGTTSQAAHSFIRKLAQDLTVYFDQGVTPNRPLGQTRGTGSIEKVNSGLQK